MNLATAPDKARALGAGASSSAAHLYNSIEHELELGNYTEEESDAGEEALGILEERFPGVRQAARSSTRPPALSQSANRNAHAGHGGRGHGGGGSSAPHGARRRSSSSSSSSPRPRPSAPQRSSSGSAGRVVERAAGVSGGDVTNTILSGLRFLLLAGLAYQVLQPGGSQAFAGALGMFQNGFRRIVDPIDPFGPYNSLREAANAGGNPATGIGTTDQSQFMRTPIHPLAAPITNPITRALVLPGVTPRRRAHITVKQPSPLAIGSNPLKIGG